MNNFVTIHAFTFPSDLIAIKGRLEAEGIECQTKDELTIQIHNFYSNAVGGVRLQVREKDFIEAKKILIEYGYIPEKEEENNFWKKVNEWTKNIPLFNKFRVELRFITLIGSALFLILFTVYGTLSYLYKKPTLTTYEYITKNSWCLNYIDYKGKTYAPKTITRNKIVFIIPNECKETIDFINNGRVFIPGFNTKMISGKWKLMDDSISISELDTLDNIFTTTYKVKKEPNQLILESKNIRIYCNNAYN